MTRQDKAFGYMCFISSKDSLDNRIQHTDSQIDERQNSLLLMAPNERIREGCHSGMHRGLHLGTGSQQAGAVGGAYAWQMEQILQAFWRLDKLNNYLGSWV